MTNDYLNVGKKIKEYGTIIIHRHSRPDGDAIGSQIGLKEILKQTFPYKKVYVVGDENEKFMFLGRMNEVKDEEYKNALAIVLDSGDDYLVSDERYKKAHYTIRIDHHLYKGKWCDLEIIEQEEVSCASIIFKIAIANHFKFNSKGAKALFIGIVTDSGRFRYGNNLSSAFLIASKLTEYGFNTNEIYNSLYLEDLNIVKIRAELVSKFKITKNHVAYLINTQDDVKKYGLDIFSMSRGMIGIMSGIKEIDIWANFTENEEGKVLVEIRSNKYNINPVAVKFGGGGHKLASGATIDNTSIISDVVNDLDKIVEENNGN